MNPGTLKWKSYALFIIIRSNKKKSILNYNFFECIQKVLPHLSKKKFHFSFHWKKSLRLQNKQFLIYWSRKSRSNLIGKYNNKLREKFSIKRSYGGIFGLFMLERANICDHLIVFIKIKYMFYCLKFRFYYSCFCNKIRTLYSNYLTIFLTKKKNFFNNFSNELLEWGFET